MTYYIYTLGCKVNTYESEVMKDALNNAGYQEGNKENADIYIINTCTVTNTANQKSRKLIRQIVRNHPQTLVIVAGCMSQRDVKSAQIDGVNIVLGNQGKSNIVTMIEQYKKNPCFQNHVGSLQDIPFETMKLNNFHHTRAFVKIEDGCNNFCSYCIIPYTRGDVRSKPKEEVLAEIKQLLLSNHREIVLTGIHTGHYGADLSYDFADLLAEIVTLKGLDRLRISSIEITEINDKILTLLKQYPVIVDHLHIPLQSGCDKTLRAMNRKYDMVYFKNKVKQIRDIRPNISLTTDVIVGFPGETEEDFTITLNNIREIGFSKVHVFPYSKRDGTKSALELSHLEIPEEIKKDRVHRLLSLSRQLEELYMKKFINQNMDFIPEVWKNGYLIGHTGNYLLVKVEGPQCFVHQMIPVMIDNIEYPYVLGKLTKSVENSILSKV